MIWLRNFAYTVSPSPWTYFSSGRYSLAVVAVRLLKLWCSLCYSLEHLQHAFFGLIGKIQETYFLLHVVDSPRSTELNKSLRFRILPAQYWIIRPDRKMEHLPPWSIRPACCITWERTCHLKHCNYVIFTSNTNEFRGVSIIKNIYCLLFVSLLSHFWLIHSFPPTPALSTISGPLPSSMGKFDWGVWYVIIFLYVQFSIRLAAVS